MLFSMLFVGLALAEEPEFEETETPGQKYEEPESNLSVEVGGALATGNAVYMVLNGAANVGHKWTQNRFLAQAGVNLGSGIADANGDGRLDDLERVVGRTQ
ncbi:MAG: hypothetical protein HN348_30185, partial [Proteobacteria bacterium]|nr:hypothetical protein [Pseudomonadota bacterium]